MSIEKTTFAERFHRSTRHQDAEPCRNCDMEYVGNYCPNCGQEAHTGAPTALAFIYEFLTRNVFERGKLPRTIWHLIRYPGGLTVDFLEGRRQRFIRPVRLYFGLSVLYFLILSLKSGGITERMHGEGEPPKAKVAATINLGAKEKADLERTLKELEANGAPPAVRAVLQSRLDGMSSPIDGNAEANAAIKEANAAIKESLKSEAGAAASVPGHDPIRFSSRMPLLTADATSSASASAASKRKDGASAASKSASGASATGSGKGDDEDGASESPAKDFDLDIDFLDKMSDTGPFGLLKKRVKRFTALPKAERGPVLLQGMLNQAPKAMFFLVPVFAMLLKLLFVFKRVPYGAHLLFAFHYHSLVFLGLLLMFLPLPDPAMALLPLTMWLYLGLAMRRTYMCGWFGAMLRLLTLSILYPIAISLALIGAVVAAVLL